MDAELFEQMARVEDRHWWFRGRRSILRRIVRALGLQEGARVIDAGCGTGANAASLPGEFRVLGVDPTPLAVERARRFQAPNLTFACGTLREVTEGAREQADLVLLLDVIEHVPDDRALVLDAVDALRRGGHLLVTVPADMRLWSRHDEVFGHYRRYEPEGLRSVYDAVPVEVRLLSHFNARLYPIIRAIRMFRPGGDAGGDTDPLKGSDLAEYPGPVNAALERIFAGEAGRLVRVLEGRARPYPRGASLMALVRKTEG